MKDFLEVVAALAEFGVGIALLIAVLSKAFIEAVFEENSVLKRAWWLWVGCFSFGAITIIMIEAIFHTLQVPLN